MLLTRDLSGLGSACVQQAWGRQGETTVSALTMKQRCNVCSINQYCCLDMCALPVSHCCACDCVLSVRSPLTVCTSGHPLVYIKMLGRYIYIYMQIPSLYAHAFVFERPLMCTSLGALPTVILYTTLGEPARSDTKRIFIVSAKVFSKHSANAAHDNLGSWMTKLREIHFENSILMNPVSLTKEGHICRNWLD